MRNILSGALWSRVNSLTCLGVQSLYQWHRISVSQRAVNITWRSLWKAVLKQGRAPRAPHSLTDHAFVNVSLLRACPVPGLWHMGSTSLKTKESESESESEVAQSCPTLCDPVDCTLPGSSVHGIFQAIVLEWIAISFSRGSSQPRDRT